MENFGIFDRLVERYQSDLAIAVKTAICAAKNHARKNKEVVEFLDSIEEFEFVAGDISDQELVFGLKFFLDNGEEVCTIDGDFQAYIDEDFAPVATDVSVVGQLTINGAILFIIETLAEYIDVDFQVIDWEDFSKFIQREFSKLCFLENLEEVIIVSFPQMFGFNSPCEIAFKKDSGSIAAFTCCGFLENGAPMYNYCAELDAGLQIFLYDEPEGDFEIYDEYPEYYGLSRKFTRVVFERYLAFLDEKEE